MNEPCKTPAAQTWKTNREYEKMWAGLEKVNTHSGVDTHAQRMNISANCPLLTGQPAPYLSCSGWVTGKGTAWTIC